MREREREQRSCSYTSVIVFKSRQKKYQLKTGETPTCNYQNAPALVALS